MNLIEEQEDIVKGIYRNYEINHNKDVLTLLLNASLRLGIMYGKEIAYNNMQKFAKPEKEKQKRRRNESEGSRLLDLIDEKDELVFADNKEARKKKDVLRNYAKYNKIDLLIEQKGNKVIVVRY